MKIVYFASVRERIGLAEEDVAPPVGIVTVSDLVIWLRGRGEGYAAAFAEGGAVRAAVDHAHAKPDAPVVGAREIAFFPPMTGG